MFVFLFVDVGMAIGDGLCDPITMTDYSEFLYQIGLVDEKAKKHFKEQSDVAIKYIKDKEWLKAFLVCCYTHLRCASCF